MLKVGITGSIGSGKTTICKIFATLDIPIYYADDRAKALVTKNQALKAKIIDLLGTDAYTPQGEYNRPYVANIVFKDNEKLKALNALIHPAVAEDGFNWQKAHASAPYTLKEAALLYEAGSYQFLDKMICVYAPEDLRIKRVMERDQVDEVAVRARMSKQWSQIDKARKADYLIYNDERTSLIEQVVQLHHKLKGFSS